VLSDKIIHTLSTETYS